MTGEDQIVLLGAGGLARETLEALKAAGRAAAGLLDDDPAKKGSAVGGVEVLGGVDEWGRLPGGTLFTATVAAYRDPARRSRLVGRLGLAAQRWATVVHPAASIASSTRIGSGTIILAQVVSTADVTVGRHVVIMPGCILTHDDVLGDGCTLASGVNLAGGVQVGDNAYLGSGAIVRENIRIGAGAVIAMGAVVTRDVPPGETWAGVPARLLRPPDEEGPR